MVAKDADLASDYADRTTFLYGESSAPLEPVLIGASQPTELGETFLVGVGPSAGGVTYRMRGNDGTLGFPVYWESSQVDSGGVDYSGPGPLTDVVVAEVIGVP